MKYIITYKTEVTDEELKEDWKCSLEDYLWEHLRPEGDDYTIEEAQ